MSKGKLDVRSRLSADRYKLSLYNIFRLQDCQVLRTRLPETGLEPRWSQAHARSEEERF